MRARPARTAIAIGLLIVVAAAVVAIVLIQPGSRRRPRPLATRLTATKPAKRPAAARPPHPAPVLAPPRHVTVQAATLRLTDPARRISVGSGVVPRSFDTVIRYPVGLPGPFPLIVFGHGYNVTPAPYHDLLDAWARAGYVVAAPIFPLENANAPGGANENDLPNQPEDMSLVISSLTRPPTPDAARIAGLVNPSEIAVAGQSDGRRHCTRGGL
jgi:predicted dienelactone hydrolase